MPSESFDEAWPALAEKLRRSLAARGVPAQDRDDVVQETALRVYRVWGSLDPDRPAWPFVVTVAVNFWRDIIRERTGRIAQVHPSATIEVTDHQDVERDVMARQELASVRVAMRALAPEQRRLLLASEEFGDVVRPLRPAERVARMRVRRQLARAVGRASAVAALLLLRRPARSSGAIAAAYASAMAATVFTAPSLVNVPLVTAAPRPAVVHHSAVHQPTRGQVDVTRPAAPRAIVGVPVAEATAHTDPSLTQAPPTVVSLPGTTRLCQPTGTPLGLLRVVVKIGATTIYGTDSSGNPEELAETPRVVAKVSHGCVHVR